MRVRFNGPLLFLAAAVCSAQPASVEVRVPTGVRSEAMFIRYILDDDFGGWVEPRPGVSAYFLTIRPGAPSPRFRALLYAPGCAIQTADLPVLSEAVPVYSFVCRPLRKIQLTATLNSSKWVPAHQIDLEVKYFAHWAQNSLSCPREPSLTFRWRKSTRSREEASSCLCLILLTTRWRAPRIILENSASTPGITPPEKSWRKSSQRLRLSGRGWAG